jgi:hypothetical protein
MDRRTSGRIGWGMLVLQVAILPVVLLLTFVQPAASSGSRAGDLTIVIGLMRSPSSGP